MTKSQDKIIIRRALGGATVFLLCAVISVASRSVLALAATVMFSITSVPVFVRPIFYFSRWQRGRHTPLANMRVRVISNRGPVGATVLYRALKNDDLMASRGHPGQGFIVELDDGRQVYVRDRHLLRLPTAKERATDRVTRTKL